jgi:hypothetical protein
VASSTCYTQDLAFGQAGTRGRDAAQAFSLVHVYPETVMHSVVPVESGPTAGEAVTAQQAQQRLNGPGSLSRMRRGFRASSTVRFPALAAVNTYSYAAKRGTLCGWSGWAARSSSHGAGAGK